MHRLIARPPDGMVVDHIDHNGLNNTRANLRVCTPQQNSRNRRSQSGRSKYKGISYDKRYKRWKARIRFQNKYIHIGTFRDEARAARAYDAKAAELFGEFACLNFPPS
ncbi:MAG: HNH endonuclease [Sedimentisphaerales bacterium]|nr:HNH endonuclease [Sedimentisphaerales bacterium]